ncbi:MAG: hypothetical protein IJ314_02615 [Bacteroidales bacterium]|nr:hypothetical protein [Bacteroidales bacterium]
MNKIYKLAALLSVCLMAFAGCAPEELSTDQLSDENVTFAAMAPNPVARGGALRIQGSNLDKVTEVRIPGVEPITGEGIIQVDSLKGRLSEIRVIVPVDGPEVGKVVIVDQDGNEFSSHADLTYSEPIIFTSFSTPNEVAFPGDVVTVKGDYMNNIRAIQFGSSKAVTVFEEQSRYELKVVVPADAVTGKVILCDVDENNNPDGNISNLFYSEKDLTIGKPTVDAKDRGVLKAGETIKVTGKYLQMIKEAKFKYTAYDEDGNPYDAYENVDFVLAEDTKSVSAVLSATVPDGELLLYSYAGDEFKAGAFKTLVPSELKHSAAKGYKAGNEVVITGKDLDLVTELTIGKAVTPFTYKDNALTATILGTSVDGTISVKLANGKTVDAADQITLVKPTITGMTPLEFYVPDQEEVKVTGTDLDLVTGAVLGTKDIDFEVVSATEIKLLPTVASVGGKLTLKLENGVTVESAETITVKYHSLVIVSEMTAAQHIGMEVIIKGANMDLIENIFIGDTKVTQYSLRTPEEVRFLMPWMKVGKYDVNFHLFNGDVETQATQIEVQLELDIKTIWEGSMHLEWNGMVAFSWAEEGGRTDWKEFWSEVKPGTVLTAYFTQDEAPAYNPQIRFGNGSWASLPTGLSIAGGEGNIALTEGATCYAITLSAADIAELTANGGLVITGTFFTLEKLTLTSEIPQEKTIWEGAFDNTGWKGLEDLSWGRYDWSTLEVGTILNVYVTSAVAAGEWYCVHLRTAGTDWPTLVGSKEQYDNPTLVSVEVTQEMIDDLNANNGLVVTGTGAIITKITLL